MEVLQAALPWLGVGMLAGVAIVTPLRLKNERRRHDLQLVLNATPRLNIVLAVASTAGIALVAVLGIALAYIGYSFGWGLLAVAVAGLVLLGQFIWLWRLPLPLPTSMDEGLESGQRPETTTARQEPPGLS